METALILGIFNILLPALVGAITALSDRIWNELTGVFLFVGVPAVTLWILVNGYMIVTGATKDPLGAYLMKAAKVFFWMLLATGASAFNGTLRDATVQFRNVSTEIVTGSTQDFWTQVATQVALMSAASATVALAARTVKDHGESDTSQTVATLGSTVAITLPIMVVGLTGFTLEAAMRIGAALAPLFFFFGIFSKFADWPLQWIKYMMGVMVSAAVMAAMSIWGLGVYVGTIGASVLAFTTGAGLVQVSAIMAAAGVLVSLLMITIPSLVFRTFGQMSLGLQAIKLDLMLAALVARR